MVIHTFKSGRALNIRKMPYVRGKFNRQYIYDGEPQKASHTNHLHRQSLST